MEAVGAATGMVSPNRAAGALSLSPARVPDVDPIDGAAHLQLLGESLSLIGHRLQETEVRFLHAGANVIYLTLCILEIKDNMEPRIHSEFKSTVCVLGNKICTCAQLLQQRYRSRISRLTSCPCLTFYFGEVL